MFLNTFDIGFKRIRYTMETCRGGSGICTPDKRGHHGNHKRISEEDRNIVIDHISKFPAYKGHYSRSHSNKRYLSPDLCIQQKCTDFTYISLQRNWKIAKFNISFHPPHNDTCSKCDKLEVLMKACSDEGDRINFEREKKAHLVAANDAYEEKRKDKDNSKKSETMITAMFDLQKCLPTPHLRSGIAFYKRQLWVFNLTVYEISCASENKSICFMWDETTSRRGGQEIASCLLKYIQNLPASTTTLNLYSDCYSGQNKNIFVTTLLSLVFDFLAPGHNLKEINHKFLVSGHTHLEADSIHASIEKTKKHTTMDIEMPRDWSTLVRGINRKGGIKVIDMTQTDFYKIGALQKAYFVNRKKNTEGEAMPFLKANYFKYLKEQPGKIFYKLTFKAEEEFKEWDITKKKKGQLSTERPILEKLHNSYPLPLPKKKLEDIRSLLCDIHPNSQLFYLNLKADSSSDDDGDVCPTDVLDYDEPLFIQATELSSEFPQPGDRDFVVIVMNTAQAEILKNFSNDTLCIDATHGLNQYDFQLITLMVIDDMKQGFPCILFNFKQI
nr:unnamed protein product [Callosobruchus chinensis]